MLNKKLFLVLVSIVFTALACGQFEIGIEPEVTNLAEPQKDTITAQDKPDSHQLSDQDNSFDEEEIETPSQFMAYTDSNGNVWVLEIGSDAPRQITFDVQRADGTSTAIEYGTPQVSSDGSLIAYLRQVGEPREWGYEFSAGIWVESLVTGEKNQILDDRTLGFSWKPNSHSLAYTTYIADENYWITRGQINSDLATGIKLMDLDKQETTDLVLPENGYTLASPKWTADGRFIFFAEVLGMEGSGNFAYYDLENEEYVGWDEAVGSVSWSWNSEYISYARHTYAASGEERIYLRSLNGEEELIGPDYEGAAYATGPAFSPTDNKLAYSVYFDGPETTASTIMVLDLDGGEPRPLGVFEGVWEIAWSLDGNKLIFSSGNWDSRQIIQLNILDGSQSIIAEGDHPSLTGQ